MNPQTSFVLHDITDVQPCGCKLPSPARSQRQPGQKASVPERGPDAQQPVPPTPPPWHQMRFVSFFTLLSYFFSHWNSLNILFSEKWEFFFIIQTCFSNLDTLQSTSNEAPSLELDPCIFYNMNPLSQSSSPQCTGVHELIKVRIYRAVPSSILQIREAGSGF